MREELLAAAMSYAARGWHVFPLRPARGDNDPKVPLAGMPWRSASTTDPRTIARWWTTDDYGIGIDCGKSDLLVIDVDVHGEKNGFDALAALDLPPTYEVSTPSRGLHLYYHRPADIWIGNDNRGKLGVGIDYRGIGGYVVAPPTAMPSGSYGVVPGSLGLPVGVPAALVARLVVPDEETRTLPQVDRPGALPTGYAASALAGLVEDYREAPSGQGNTAMFAALCRGLELVNAEWCELDEATLLFALDEARNHRGRQTDREWQASLNSAYRTVGARAAVKPAERRSEFDQWMADTAAKQASTGSGSIAQVGAPGVQEVPPPFDQGELGRFMAELISTFDQREALPDPVWLVRDWLETNSTFSIVGASGSMKSFLALDLAAHVALGLPWHGHPVVQSPVMLVVAEGVTGLRKRIAAWEDHYERVISGLHVFPRAIQAAGPEWPLLIEACRVLGVGLVVLDTQARVTVGMEENSATEMGVFVQKMDMVRVATGAACGVVHHTGRAGMQDGGRGSTALYAAWTTEFGVVKSDDGIVRVESNKEKDGPDDQILEFKPAVISLGKDAYGYPLTSVVLTRQDTEVAREQGQRARLVDCMSAVLSVIAGDLYSDGQEFTRIDLGPFIMGEAGFTRRTMHRAVTEMLNRGIILETGKSGRNQKFVYVRDIAARVRLVPNSVPSEIDE
jgi:hypothetical protein